ncbi:hypothetical protein FACS1894191_8820 [Clostridia bacterium]|nr:hypothetical protein FACS1894191_8820 [Clostridia bacterium]
MAQDSHTVVRNSGKTAAQFEVCERHNGHGSRTNNLTERAMRST